MPETYVPPLESAKYTKMLEQLAIDGRDIGRLMAVHRLQLIAARHLGNELTFRVLIGAIEEIREIDVSNV